MQTVQTAEITSDAPTTARWTVSASGLAAVLTQPGIIVLVWIGLAVHAAIIIHQAAARWTRWDFSHYYVSALAMREGLNPYLTDLRPLGACLGLEGINRSNYPPPFILSFEPLTFLTPHAAWLTWLVLNLAALATATVWLLEPWRNLGKRKILAIAALALLYPPVSTNIFYSQTQILLLLMLVIVMRELGKGCDVTAGFVLGIAGLLKVFPLIMTGYLVTKSRWRALGATVISFAAGLAAVIAEVGVQRTIDFTAGAQAALAIGFINRPANIAISSFVSRLFWYGAGLHSSPAIETARQLSVLGAQLGVLLLTVAATFSRKSARDDEWRAYSLWIAATILLSPTAWIHYLAMLLLPFVAIAAAGWRGRASSRALWLMVASYSLITLSMLVAGSAANALNHAPIVKTALEECATVSLLLAYASAWFFAFDEPRGEGGQGGVIRVPRHRIMATLLCDHQPLSQSQSGRSRFTASPRRQASQGQKR